MRLQRTPMQSSVANSAAHPNARAIALLCMGQYARAGDCGR
jgi:hypothetical protein